MINTLYTGNTLAFKVTPQIDGVSVSEMYGTLHFIVKANLTDSDDDAVINEKSTTGEFTISAETTSAIKEGRYWYEIRWVFSGETVIQTLEIGNIKVVKSVFDNE